VLVATLKVPVATCGEWRQGWTTLLYAQYRVIGSLYLFFTLILYAFVTLTQACQTQNTVWAAH